MIEIHLLEYSRAIRLVWLLEDLGQPYDIVKYERTKEFRAPEELASVHPLGKSPVAKIDGKTLAESATILRYITDKYADDTHCPEKETPDYWRHEEFLDYVESSFAPVAMRVMLPRMSGKEPAESAKTAFQQNKTYIASQLPPDGMLFGDTATLADIQLSYLLANLSRLGLLSDAPRLEAYWETLQQQPGYKSAVEKAGEMAPPK